MDFASLMAAASGNKERASETKGSSLLKTKLSAPKKDERRKVDVEAIKRRLDEEKKKKDAPKPAKPKYDAKVQSKIKTLTPKADTKSTKRDNEKVKPYKDKEHEEKHNLFMKNVRRIGSTNSKNSGKPEKLPGKLGGKPANGLSNPISIREGHGKDKKPRAMAPNFKQLMALAEKVTQATPPNGADKTTCRSRERTPDRLRLGSSPTPRSRNKPNTDKSQPDVISTKSQKETKNYLRSNPNRAKDFQSKSSHSKSSVDAEGARKDAAYGGRTSDRKELASLAKHSLSDSQIAKLAIRNSGKRCLPPPPKQAEGRREVSKPSKGKAAKQPQRDSPVTGEVNMLEKKRKFNPYESSDGKSAWDRIMPAATVKPSSSKHYVESESDYDEYDDDFIDDDEPEVDVSKEIRDIFGYDKRRYKDEDFDDRQMESRYADIMKEEVRSSKLATKEDLEEQRKEEEARKRKLLKKKK